MALQASGAISLADIATEFGGSAPHSLSEYYGDGNAPASGAIDLANDFYGTSNRVTINLTINSHRNNYNIWNSKGSSYIAGNTDVILTINTNIRVGSGNINSFALDTGSGWSSGDTITIINNGYIRGRGGNGGRGAGTNGTQDLKGTTVYGAGQTATNGQRGGHALRLRFATSIRNNKQIHSGGGGGGGGGSGKYLSGTVPVAIRGSGGGGGGGRNVGSGGAGGTHTGSGSAPTGGVNGSNGGFTSGGARGNAVHADGGNGGSVGNAGANGQNPNSTVYRSRGTGGGKGNYITGNSNATWLVTGTRGGNVA